MEVTCHSNLGVKVYDLNPRVSASLNLLVQGISSRSKSIFPKDIIAQKLIEISVSLLRQRITKGIILFFGTTCIISL